MGYRRNIYAVDLFCGVGGLTHGLRRSGVKVRLGVDIDPACEYPYEKNNEAKFLLKAVERLEVEDILPYFRKNGIKLLAGCAPCQTFSTYNQRALNSDRRWCLIKQFSRTVDALSPELVTMENVPRLSEQGVFLNFVEHLKKNGYFINDRMVVNCSDYGVPQQRNRLVLVASRLGPIDLLSPTEFGRRRKTVKEAIGKLPRLESGKTDPKDPLHRCAKLSKTNISRIRASKPGGTWRDWPTTLIADCHKKETGKTYPSVYGRMTWCDPSPTVTTQFFGYGNGRFGHPEQDRAISLREGAILQSFPDDYIFVPPGGKIHRKVLGRLIGNAVPVTLGEVIGKTFLAHVADMT